MNYDFESILFIFAGMFIILFRKQLLKAQAKFFMISSGELSTAIRRELQKSYMPTLVIFIGLIFMITGTLHILGYR